VLWHLIKDPALADNPPNPAWHPDQPSIDRLLQVNSCDHPDIHDVVAEMRSVVDCYNDRVLIGEIYLPLERLVAYYGRNLGGAHLPFNFQLIFTAWSAVEIARIIHDYEAAVPEGAWPNWVLSNHDQKRIATRIGPAEARVAAMLLLSLRGTPTLYYGDELGLEDVPIPPNRVQDPWEKNEPGLGFGRDPARTPMPWDGSPKAGFTTGEPWLPLNPDWRERNVEALEANPSSILNLYRELIELRRIRPALHLGDYAGAHVKGNCLAFERRSGGERLLIALNLGHQSEEIPLPPSARAAQALLSTHLDRRDEVVRQAVKLRPAEGLILHLSEAA
jgi:alpha-glucosidase